MQLNSPHSHSQALAAENSVLESHVELTSTSEHKLGSPGKFLAWDFHFDGCLGDSHLTKEMCAVPHRL